MRRNCDLCGVAYDAKRAGSRFCCEAHRVEAFGRRKKGLPESRATIQPLPAAQESPVTPSGGVFAATRSELEAAGRAESALGLTALALAERIDAKLDSGSSLAALAARLEATLATAMKGAEKSDALDELARRRAQRRGA